MIISVGPDAGQDSIEQNLSNAIKKALKEEEKALKRLRPKLHKAKSLKEYDSIITNDAEYQKASKAWIEAKNALDTYRGECGL